MIAHSVRNINSNHPQCRDVSVVLRQATGHQILRQAQDRSSKARTSGISSNSHQTTTVTRFVKVQGDKSTCDGDWVYWSNRLGCDPSKPRRVTRLLKRQRGCCALRGLRFTTEDVIEMHHYDENHNNNTFDNLRLLHGHCHTVPYGPVRCDLVHGSGCL